MFLKGIMICCTVAICLAAGCSNAAMTEPVIVLDTSATPGIFKFPEPIILKIRLHGPQPISQARVTAEITGPGGAVSHVVFRELGGNSPHDVLYCAVVNSIQKDGLHIVRVHADDNQGRAGFSTGLESEDRPGRDTVTKPEVVPSFSAECVYQFSAYGYENQHEFRPAKTKDLYVEPTNNGCFRVIWTAPLGLAPASRYEVVSAGNDFSLENEVVFNVLVTAPYAVKGGDRQVQEICLQGTGTFYLAIRSVSPNGWVSLFSNDYAVTIEPK